MSAGAMASARVSCRGCHLWFHPAVDTRVAVAHVAVTPLRCPNCGTEMSARTILALAQLARPAPPAPEENDRVT